MYILSLKTVRQIFKVFIPTAILMAIADGNPMFFLGEVLGIIAALFLLGFVCTKIKEKEKKKKQQNAHLYE